MVRPSVNSFFHTQYVNTEAVAQHHLELFETRGCLLQGWEQSQFQCSALIF